MQVHHTRSNMQIKVLFYRVNVNLVLNLIPFHLCFPTRFSKKKKCKVFSHYLYVFKEIYYCYNVFVHSCHKGLIITNKIDA